MGQVIGVVVLLVAVVAACAVLARFSIAGPTGLHPPEPELPPPPPAGRAPGMAGMSPW
jgi:hypothetical protein